MNDGYRAATAAACFNFAVPALIAYISAQADPVVDLRVERPTLEDRFLEITTKGPAR